ncbi:MAG: hypothetical protein BGO87_05435 [Flavobacteriia bacterium 40-80]|nr:MAG: hypothetical protein BGO87_05435 [Flavobacteriia bacterium 40-80]
MKTMRKILLSCLFTAGFSAIAAAQCTPGPNYGNGIYPDTTTNFVRGCKNTPYEQVVSIKVPADTAITYAGTSITAHFNYIEVQGVSGLPTGFDMQCNPNNCKFLGNDVGCAVIAGTTSEVGTHNLTFSLNANLTTDPLPVVGPQTINQPYQLTSYRIIIDEECTTSTTNLTNNASFEVFPNPAKGLVTISNLSDDGSVKSIHIFNAEGKVVKTFFTENNSIQFLSSNFTSGIYFVKVIQKNTQETVKLIIE